MWAARRGDIDSLRTLIEFGADVKKPDRSKVTPIHKAVADADDECVEILLEAGADVNVSDLQLGQPIHGIFFSPLNRTATIDALVAHGANLDACNATDSRPLHWAASMQKEGRLDNVRHFVYRGADINAVDFWGDSPVMEALRCSDAELFGCLIELGARLDLRRKKGDINILHIAAWSADMECWDILANAAKVGKLYGVDTRTPHEGHSVLDCLEACRDKMFAGERGSRELEKEKFSALIRLVEGTLTSVFELQA
jgi:ankyrin repeat protein